jgi:predicted alpha/beta superfamily hydrolase
MKKMKMKKSILIFASLFFMVSSLKAQEKRKTDSLILSKRYSKILSEERKIIVHLPLNYSKESSKKYPVMYVLDASKLDFDISDRLFAYSSAEIIPECIVVGLMNNKGKRELDLTPPFMQIEVDSTDSPYGKGDQFLKFMETELIPYIDSTYRTTNYRTIIGHSRSGLFVLYTLIENPSLFNARFCYSTPAWRFDNMIIKKVEFSLKNRKIDAGYLYLSVGENENPNIKASFYDLNKTLKKVKKIKLDTYVTPLADHQSNPIFSIGRGIAKWADYLNN